jgi:hypothetical protein
MRRRQESSQTGISISRLQLLNHGGGYASGGNDWRCGAAAWRPDLAVMGSGLSITIPAETATAKSIWMVKHSGANPHVLHSEGRGSVSTRISPARLRSLLCRFQIVVEVASTLK